MIMVDKISTQKKAEEGVLLRGRTEDDITNMIYYVLCGNQKVNPVLTGTRGFCSYNPADIATEIINTQILYNKRNGLRVRGFIITIPMTDLHPDRFMEELNQIGFDISSYFFYKGFQNVYGIFRGQKVFKIWYVLNTVSYEDGAKFIINNTDRLSDLYVCAQSVVNRVTGIFNSDFDFQFSNLEYYPYSFEMNSGGAMGENNNL